MAKTFEFFTMESDKEKRKIIITEDKPVDRITSIEEMKRRVVELEIQIKNFIIMRNALIDEINEISSGLAVEIVDPLPYKAEVKVNFINEKGEIVEESKPK